MIIHSKAEILVGLKGAIVCLVSFVVGSSQRMNTEFGHGGVFTVCIVEDAKGNKLLKMLIVNENAIGQVELDGPLTHSLVVVTYNDNTLLVFNKYNRYWELPGGVIEEGETPRQCAERELNEETNQHASALEFKGFMKFHLQPDFHGPERIEYGALYAARIDDTTEFKENDEVERIIWWDGRSDIGYINEIDRSLTQFS